MMAIIATRFSVSGQPWGAAPAPASAAIGARTSYTKFQKL